jgi:hypothetical protein
MLECSKIYLIPILSENLGEDEVLTQNWGLILLVELLNLDETLLHRILSGVCPNRNATGLSRIN